MNLNGDMQEGGGNRLKTAIYPGLEVVNPIFIREMLYGLNSLTATFWGFTQNSPGLSWDFFFLL